MFLNFLNFAIDILMILKKPMKYYSLNPFLFLPRVLSLQDVFLRNMFYVFCILIHRIKVH